MMNFTGVNIPSAAAASMWMHPFVHPSVPLPMPMTSTVSTEILQTMYPYAQIPTQAPFGYGFPFLPAAAPGYLPVPGAQAQPGVNPLEMALAASDLTAKDQSAPQLQSKASGSGDTEAAAHAFVRIPVPVRVSPALSARSSSHPLSSSAPKLATHSSPARSLASSPSSQASSIDSDAQTRPLYLPKSQTKSSNSAFTTAQTARGFTLNLARGRLPSALLASGSHPREKLLEESQRPSASELEAIRSLFGHAEAKSRGALSTSSSSVENSVSGVKRRRSAPEALEDSDVDSAIDSEDDEKGSLSKLLRASSSSRSPVGEFSDRKPICQTCSRVCEGWEELVEHQQTHSRGNSHACPICDKAFKRSDHMIIHIRGHTGERPYRCGHCKKCYPSKSSLMRHKRIHNHGLDTDDIL